MTYSLYWGDLHCHCGISYGYGSLKRALRLAREHLDFCSVTGHAFWPDIPTDHNRYGHIIDFHERGFARLQDQWPKVLATTASRHEPGRFVPFLSYEWHSFAFGDHNVYFRGDEAELLTGDDLDQLTRAVAPFGALVIPHHIGYGRGYRGINWDAFDEGRSPVVEVFSSHGCSESDGAPYPIYHVMGPRCYEGTAACGLDWGSVSASSLAPTTTPATPATTVTDARASTPRNSPGSHCGTPCGPDGATQSQATASPSASTSTMPGWART